MLLSPFRLLPIVSPSTKPRMFVRLCLFAGGQQTRDTVPLHLVSASPSINLNMLLLLYNSSRLHLSPPASGFPSCACDSFDVMKSPRCRLRDKLKTVYRKKLCGQLDVYVRQLECILRVRAPVKLGILPFVPAFKKGEIWFTPAIVNFGGWWDNWCFTPNQQIRLHHGKAVSLPEARSEPTTQSQMSPCW